VHSSSGADSRTQSSFFEIKAGGRLLSSDEMSQVLDVTVEQDLVLPDTFAIRMHDISDMESLSSQVVFPLLNGERFKVGDPIEITAGREDTPKSILVGEITSLEMEVRSDRVPILTLRGYDRSIRLHRERKIRSFLNFTDGDIVRKIAREHGLAAKIDTTSEVYPHIVQDNQTDWEFLRGRARRLGFELFVTDRTLAFRKPPAQGAAVKLTLGIDLHQLRLRASAPAQVSEVSVSGWDPRRKRPTLGKATKQSRALGYGWQKSGADVARALGAGKYAITNQMLTSQSEATTRAQASLDEIADGFVQLEGLGLGDANIRPGALIAVAGVGTRFSGNYYVSAALHRVTADEGYVTRFSVSGRQPANLTALLTQPRAGSLGDGAAGTGRLGVVVAVVTNNRDPENRGRVKVKYPWLSDTVESHWARLVSPMAGNTRGFYWLPEVNDEVLVAFEHGDVNHPYVVGGLWNGVDLPPMKADQVLSQDGKVDRRIIQSRTGHVVTLDDSTQTPSISIVDRTGRNSIKVDSKNNNISVYAQGDLTLEARGSVNIKGRAVNIQAEGQAVTVSANAGDVSVRAQKGLTLRGTNSQIEGTAAMKVKGGGVTDVESNGVTNIKGSLVKLN
jgi:phage protein D/phage baseplate assembly protein gpV